MAIGRTMTGESVAMLHAMPHAQSRTNCVRWNMIMDFKECIPWVPSLFAWSNFLGWIQLSESALRPREVGHTAACNQRMSHNPSPKDDVIEHSVQLSNLQQAFLIWWSETPVCAGCTIMGSEKYVVLVGNGFTAIGRGDQQLKQHRELKEKGDEHIDIQDCVVLPSRDPLRYHMTIPSCCKKHRQQDC